MTRLLLLVVALAFMPGCLVLSLNPSYEGETIGWDPALLGSWQAVDDKASIEVERGEWKSYRIKYVHPVETGTLTGHLTSIGDDRFLDVMPGVGEDRGSFLLPAHALLRVELDGDRLELTPLSYDWMNDRLRQGTRPAGLNVVLDSKENALILASTTAFRTWLRRQPKDGPMFGAPVTFVRGGARREQTGKGVGE